MNYRHGDLALIRIDKLPKELIVSKENVLLIGSGGNPHTFTGGKFYPSQGDNFVIGYFVAEKKCVLYHTEHGKAIKGKKLLEAKIAEGTYELRRQCEDTNSGMKKVED